MICNFILFFSLIVVRFSIFSLALGRFKCCFPSLQALQIDLLSFFAVLNYFQLLGFIIQLAVVVENSDFLETRNKLLKIQIFTVYRNLFKQQNHLVFIKYFFVCPFNYRTSESKIFHKCEKPLHCHMRLFILKSFKSHMLSSFENMSTVMQKNPFQIFYSVNT